MFFKAQQIVDLCYVTVRQIHLQWYATMTKVLIKYGTAENTASPEGIFPVHEVKRWQHVETRSCRPINASFHASRRTFRKVRQCRAEQAWLCARSTEAEFGGRLRRNRRRRRRFSKVNQVLSADPPSGLACTAPLTRTRWFITGAGDVAAAC